MQSSKESSLTSGSQLRRRQWAVWSKLSELWNLSRLLRVGVAMVGTLVLAALLQPLLNEYLPTRGEDPLRAGLFGVLEAPSPAHPLGTDRLGHDTLALLLC